MTETRRKRALRMYTHRRNNHWYARCLLESLQCFFETIINCPLLFRVTEQLQDLQANMLEKKRALEDRFVFFLFISFSRCITMDCCCCNCRLNTRSRRFFSLSLHIRLRRKRQNGHGSSSHHEEHTSDQDTAEAEVNMLTEVRYLSLLIPMLIVWSFTFFLLLVLAVLAHRRHLRRFLPS